MLTPVDPLAGAAIGILAPEGHPVFQSRRFTQLFGLGAGIDVIHPFLKA